MNPGDINGVNEIYINSKQAVLYLYNFIIIYTSIVLSLIIIHTVESIKFFIQKYNEDPIKRKIKNKDKDKNNKPHEKGYVGSIYKLTSCTIHLLFYYWYGMIGCVIWPIWVPILLVLHIYNFIKKRVRTNQ